MNVTGVRRRVVRRGSALVEISLMMIPLFGLLFGLMDFGFAIFLRSTLQHAAREGVRYAVTYQLQTDQNGDPMCQNASIKEVVEKASMGFLSGSNSDKIKVRYYKQNYSTGTFDEVAANGNQPGNVVEVSVEGYSYSWISPIWWGSQPLMLNTRSSDRMEGLPDGQAAPCAD